MRMGLKRSQNQGETKQTGKPGVQIANEGWKRTEPYMDLNRVQFKGGRQLSGFVRWFGLSYGICHSVLMHSTTRRECAC